MRAEVETRPIRAAGIRVDGPDPRPRAGRGRFLPVGIAGASPAAAEAARASFHNAGGGHVVCFAASTPGSLPAVIGQLSDIPGVRALVVALDATAPDAATLGAVLDAAGRAAVSSGTIALIDAPGDRAADASRVVGDAVRAVPDEVLGQVAAYYPGLVHDQLPRSAAAAVAGCLVRFEERDGPWGPTFAVAGVGLGTDFPAVRLRPAEELALREAGINPVRTLQGTGAVAWGDSTLASPRADRSLTSRTAVSAITRELQRALAWSAFEADGPGLRARLRRDASDVLRGAWEAGVLDGDSAAAAYAVALADAPAPERGSPTSPPVLDIWVRPARSLERVHVRLHAESGVATKGLP